MLKLIDAEGQREWREHWPVVVASMMGVLFSIMHLLTLGVMIAPLHREFGWSRAEITFGPLLIPLVGLPLSPLIGLAIDRYGPRRIGLAGVMLYCAALAALSLAQQPIWTWWLLWLLLAFAFLFVTPTVWVTAVTSLFSASRGLALAVLLTANGIAALVMPILTYTLIKNFGWRGTYIFMGSLAAAITLPMLYFFFFSAKDRSRLEQTVASSPDHQGCLILAGVSVRAGLGSFAFFKLAFVGVGAALVFNGLFVNFVPILISSGIRPPSAAAIAGLGGITSIIGRLGAGQLLDRFNARIIGAIAMTFPVVSCLLLIVFAGSKAAAAIAILLFGLAAASELDVLSYLSSRLFGLRNFGAIFGIIIGFVLLGAGGGPFLANLIYDFSGSYHIDLLIAMALCLVNSYCFLSTGPYPKFEEDGAIYLKPIQPDEPGWPGVIDAPTRAFGAEPLIGPDQVK
jgi:MFS family permease